MKRIMVGGYSALGALAAAAAMGLMTPGGVADVRPQAQPKRQRVIRRKPDRSRKQHMIKGVRP